MPRNVDLQDISLNDLRACLETAQQGTISAAAKVLGIAQPSLSWTLRKIEERFDVELFVRSKKGVRPTRSGKLFLHGARRLIRQWQELESTLRDEQEQVRGTYSIGVYATLAAHTLPRFLPELLREWPELRIDLEHGSSREIADKVTQLHYDMGIVVNPPRHPDLTIVDLYGDVIRMWRAPNSGWKRKTRGVPIICNPQMRSLAEFFRSLEDSGDFPEFRSVHTNDLGLTSRLTAAGCGIGIIPTSIAETEPAGPLVPLRGTLRLRDRICLIWRGDTQRSRGSRVIRSAIQKALTESVSGTSGATNASRTTTLPSLPD